MRKIILSIFVFIVLICSVANAQPIFSVQYKSEANGNEGFWFFTKYKSEAKFPIYFCDYKSEADIVIYFAEYKSEAGWKNSSKKHLFY